MTTVRPTLPAALYTTLFATLPAPGEIHKAALAREREQDKAIKSLTWELDQMKRLSEQQLAELTEQLRTLRQVSKVSWDMALGQDALGG